MLEILSVCPVIGANAPLSVGFAVPPNVEKVNTSEPETNLGIVTVPTRPGRRTPDDRHIEGNCPDVGSDRSATPGDPVVFAVVGLNAGAVGFRRWRGWNVHAGNGSRCLW